MKYIYLIRHSSPFVEIENYNDYKNVFGMNIIKT